MAKMISEHFSESEFQCKHCQRLPPAFRDGSGNPLSCYQFFFDALEDIRAFLGKPLTINSGYRCPEYNRQIGGEPMSVHQFGLAADLGCSSEAEVRELVEAVISVAPHLRRGWKQYLAKGQTFVHVDSGFDIWPRPSVNFQEGVEW